MNAVKSSFVMLLRVCAPFALLLTACGEPRISGICYCHFFSGDDSEYDVRDLDLEEQRAECIQHDKDAEGFAGDCELEE